MEIKKKIFLFVSVIYILLIVLPLASDILSVPIAVLSISVTVALFLLYPMALKNKTMFWFLIYATVLFIYLLIGKPLAIGIGTVGDTRKIIIEFAFMLPSLAIFSILYYHKDYQLYKTIGKASLIILILSFVYFIPIIINDPGLLREALYFERNELPVKGLPNYTLLHAYIIAFPAQLYGISRFDGWKKWGLIAIVILYFYIIVSTSITTTLIIAIGLILFALLYSPEKKLLSLFKLFLVFFLIYLLYAFGAFVSILDWAINFFEGTSTQLKMIDFKDILLTGSTDNAGTITGRRGYHDLSIEAFKNNPFFGSEPVGGHSNILDRLGGLGLFGFIPYAMIFYTQLKSHLKYTRGSVQRIYYYVGLFATLVFLYTKGLFGQEGWLFLLVILPSMLIWYGESISTSPNNSGLGNKDIVERD